MATLKVEVVCAFPKRASLVTVTLAEGATVGDALAAAGLDAEHGRIGIFGAPATPRTRLADGDRVEIYRPLEVDPKEARRRRAVRRG